MEEDRIRQLERQPAEIDRLSDAAEDERTKKIDLLNELAWTLSDTNAKRAYDLSEEAYTLADPTADGYQTYPAGMAYSLRTQGYVNQRLGNYPLGLTQLLKAQQIFETLQLEDGLPDVLDGLAGIYYQIGDFPESLNFIYKQLEAAQRLGDSRLIANAKNNLANIYSATGEYERAIDTQNENLKTAVDTGYKRIECLSYLNLAEIYLLIGETEKALENCLNALPVSQQSRFELFETYSLHLIGKSYLQLGDIQQAIHYFEKALAKSAKLESKVTDSLILLDLGRAFQNSNRLDQALATIEQGLLTAKLIDARSELFKAHLLLSEIYEKKGEFAQALSHFKEYHASKELVFGEKADQRLKVLQIAHETETAQKEAEILQLKTYHLEQEVAEQRKKEKALQQTRNMLEEQVKIRTAELNSTITENIVRKNAEARLDRKLSYERALAGCSQSLLSVVETAKEQGRILNQALEHLRLGANASRAYIFKKIIDPDLGSCLRILAEACGPEILPHINNPGNQRFPLSSLPAEMIGTLQTGSPFGGPVQQIFASTPELIEIFLNQSNPLLSIQLFPIFLNNQWWGFAGFDDCMNARYWDEQEILLLQTAAEMIGNTIQRWLVEESLRETLANLEQRVQERTIEYSQVNRELRYEIREKQRFQSELEARLGVESRLAKISAQLLSSVEPRSAIQETMADLGQIMQARQVAFIPFAVGATDLVGELIEWHATGETPFPIDSGTKLNDTYAWLNRQFEGTQSFFINDVANLPNEAHAERDLLIGSGISALVATPIFADGNLAGVIACSNSDLSAPQISDNIDTVEVVARMLSSLLQRNSLLITLEEKVSERTRELAAFFDMTMLSSEAGELADIMQPALARVIEISASQAGLIHVSDTEQCTLELVTSRGLPKAHPASLQTLQLDQSLHTWMEKGDPNDDFGRVNPAMLPVAFAVPGFKTVIHISLRSRGKLQGILSCYRREKIPYDPYQISFLTAIGEQLGMAVENFRLRMNAEETAAIQERQRLARELHDAVSQSLYSLTLFARSSQDAYQSGQDEKLLENLTQIESNSLAALKEMRLLLYQLRSLSLEEGNLYQAIESRFNLVERRMGIQATIQTDDSIELSGQTEQELFRLVSEALNNALKHSAATKVSVTMQLVNEKIVLQVWDNGVGFEPYHPAVGMGLQNMRERASALGGSFELTSQVGSGTQIHVTIPLSSLDAE